MDRPDFFPLVTEEHAAAIGYVALRWSEVEGIVATFLSELLNLNFVVGDCLTAELPALTLLNLVTVMISLTANPQWIASWRKLELEYERIRPLRNDAIHGEWHSTPQGHVAFRKSAKRKLHLRAEWISDKTLNTLSDDCLGLFEDILKFISVVCNGPKGETGPDLLRLPIPPGSNQAPTPAKPKKVPRPPKLSAAQKRKAREIDGG